jgi:hypothetical protein
MSLVTEILDRLSGIAAVREHLNMTSQRVEKIAGTPPPKPAPRLRK